MASRITGFSEMVARLNSYSTNVQQEVKGILDYHIGEIGIEATALAPGETIQTQDGPIPLDHISSKRQKGYAINQNIGDYIEPSGYKGSVFVEQSVGDIAAYVEFGTGQSAATYLATVPQYWRALARKYYVNGQGTIVAKPFMLPPFLKHSIEFKKAEEMISELKQNPVTSQTEIERAFCAGFICNLKSMADFDGDRILKKFEIYKNSSDFNLVKI